MDLTIYNLLMQRDVALDDVVVPSGVPGMDLLPSNIDLSAAEVQLVHEVAREQTLQRVLAPALDPYDVILIDCQPSLGLLTVNALTASDGVIVPLECEYFALRGVALLKQTIDKVRERLNPRLEIDGVLGTMFDGRTLHSREVMERLVQAWGDTVFHTVIRRTVKFSDSTVAGEPITSLRLVLGRCRLLPPAGQGGARPVARRVSLPAADDLFRPTSHGRPAEPQRAVASAGARRHPRARGRDSAAAQAQRPGAPRREDDGLRHLRRAARHRAHPAGAAPRATGSRSTAAGWCARRMALVLADFEAHGDDSALVRRLTEE